MSYKPYEKEFPTVAELITEAMNYCMKSGKRKWPEDHWITYSEGWDLNFFIDRDGHERLVVHRVEDGNILSDAGIRLL